MERGRPELLRFLPLGLFVTGVSTGDEGWIGDVGRMGVELRCGLVARRGLGVSLVGEELGDGSLVLCPDNWDINDKTGGYFQVISINEEESSHKTGGHDGRSLQ